MVSAIKSSKTYAVIILIGVVLIILGLFTAGRTGLNMLFFKQYPILGSSPLGFLGFTGSYQVYGPTGPITREEDCRFYQVQPAYYTSDGEAREPTKKELETEKEGQELCRINISEARTNTKIQDISSAILLLSLGSGILISSKFLFKNQA